MEGVYKAGSRDPNLLYISLRDNAGYGHDKSAPSSLVMSTS